MGTLKRILFGVCLIASSASWAQQINKTPFQLIQSAIFGPNDVLIGETGQVLHSTRTLSMSNLLEVLASQTNWNAHVGGQATNAIVVAASPSISTSTNGLVVTPFFSPGASNWIYTLINEAVLRVQGTNVDSGGGTAGQVLTATASGANWSNVPPTGAPLSAGVDILTNTIGATIGINLNTNATNLASLTFSNLASLTGGSATIVYAPNGLTAPGAGTTSERFGLNSSAAGNNGTSLGNSAGAGGLGATAVGKSAVANGPSATAIGSSSSANGTDGTSVGAGATSSDLLTAAFGENAISLDSGALALGGNAFSSRTNTTAVGVNTSATNDFSTVIGQGAFSTATHQITIGTNGESVITPGNFTTAGPFTNQDGTVSGKMTWQDSNGRMQPLIVSGSLSFSAGTLTSTGSGSATNAVNGGLTNNVSLGTSTATNIDMETDANSNIQVTGGTANSGGLMRFTNSLNTNLTQIATIKGTNGSVMQFGGNPPGVQWQVTNLSSQASSFINLDTNGNFKASGAITATTSNTNKDPVVAGLMTWRDLNGREQALTNGAGLEYINGNLSASGQTFYVATNGSSSNLGTTNSPWDSVSALASCISNDDRTIIVMPGTYTAVAAFTIPAGASRFTLRSQFKWQAIVAPTSGYGIVALTPPYPTNIMIDGFYVKNAGNDGIGINGSRIIIRNNWIQGSQWQGINLSGIADSNNIVQFNLVENNGATNDAANGAHFHNAYISGPNNIVEGNVFRFPTNGANIQLYTSTAGSPLPSTGNIFRNNFTYGATNLYGTLIWQTNASVSSSALGTNICENNTILDGISTRYGTILITNNIILPCTNLSSTAIVTAGGVTVDEDYNLGTNTLGGGTHDNTSGTFAQIGFVNPTTGLYWLSGTNSAAEGMALSTVYPPYNFFSVPLQSVTHVGAVGYHFRLAGDTRTMLPTPSYGADYWLYPIWRYFPTHLPTISSNIGITVTGSLNADGSTNYSIIASNVPNASLVNPSLTVAGTANQVAVSGGGPVALGGTATVSTPAVFIAPGTISAVTGMTNQAFASAGWMTNDASGKFYSSATVNYGALNLGVKTVTLDASYLWPGDTLAPSWTTNTPGAGSGAIQSAGGSIKAWSISQTASNRWLLQWKIPPDWDGNAVNLAIGVVSATNVAVVNVTNTWDVAAALMGSAAGTAIMITNNLPIGTALIRTNFDCNGITIAGSPAVNDPVLFYIESRGGFSAWSSTNTELLVNCTIRYNGSATQNGQLTFP